MPQREIHEEYIPNLAALTAKKRVAAYARVSGDREEAFHSLSAQTSYYQRIISENPEWEFAGVFSDRGITGTKDARPGFQAMLTACREKKIDMVLAKSITRFARNTVILLETVRELKSLDIAVYFEEEHINTLSGEGELMISLLAARAQEESRSASENKLWQIRRMFEKGLPVTGDCLGYRMVDHELLVVEEEEETVRRIFDMYLSGMGKTAIAKKLTEEGVKNRFGKVSWGRESIARILRNEKYCGDLCLQKRYYSDYISKKDCKNHGQRKMFYIKDDHDAILPKEQFEAVQREIDRRSAHKGDNTVKYPFSSLIRCQNCGKHFIRKNGDSGTKYAKPVWACQTSDTYGKAACPMSQKLREDILIQKTCEILGVDEIDQTTVLRKIKEIIVPENNVLVYVFRDGTEQRVEWQFRSRRESWTPEMKAAARARSILYYQTQKEGKNA